MAQVKGIAVASCLRFVRDRYGEEGLQRLKAALRPEHRAMVDGHVLPHAWAPFELILDLNVEADRLFGAGDLQLCLELGRAAANASLPTIFKLFYRLGSPSLLLDKAPKLWSAHYDSGRLVIVANAERNARLRIEEFDTPHRAQCLAVMGWALEAIEMSGARVREAEETLCRTRGDPCCEYAASWLLRGEKDLPPRPAAS
jgi:hypothetical protein